MSHSPDQSQPCYRHPKQAATVFCQRCQRPICTACMREAPVGFQCPQCISQGAKETRSGQGPFGGTISLKPAQTSIVLIVINVAIWAAIVASGGYQSPLLNVLALHRSGKCSTGDHFYPSATADWCHAQHLNWIAGVLDGAPWQIITSAFTHVEWWHIVTNMMTLWFLGPVLESILGRARFLAVYLGSALCGSAIVLLFTEPWTFTVGASGAGFGMLGALLVLAWRGKGDWRGVLTWLGINMVITFLFPGISWQGHLGGLIGGIALSAILVFSPRNKNRNTLQWIGVSIVILISLVLIFGAGMLLAR